MINAIEGALATGMSYGRSIVNLAAAIGARFGARPSPLTLAQLHASPLGEAIADAHCIVLLLLDGVGCAQINALCPGGALATSRLCELQSTFPSSTAPAVTTFATGQAPGAHAVTGWHLWSQAHQAIVRSLPLDFRDHQGFVEAASLFDWTPLSLRMQGQMTVLQPASIADSAFTRHAFAGARRMGYSRIAELRKLITEAAGRRTASGHYVYAYLPQYDSNAHEHGCRSVPAHDTAQAFDALFSQLADDLDGTGTLLLATADHGFIDIPRKQHLRLESFPAIAEMLASPISGEPRVAFCRVRPGLEQTFSIAVSESLGHAFDCVDSNALVEAGWFGPAESVTDSLRERLGSYTLIGRDHYCISQTLPGEKPHRFIGMHGGLHPDETRVAVSVMRDGIPLCRTNPRGGIEDV